jgi:LmbE family N-acetylglucosaminyl deacetylase
MKTLRTFLPRKIGTLLGIWAHPDDEAYLSAALMAVVRRSGGRVVVVTATRGELGTDDPEGCPPQKLAPVRERELLDSLAVIDVREHVWLDHRDGELPSVPAAVGVAEIEHVLDSVCPDTIVTFGPEGMTGHADHQAVSAWVTEACRVTGRLGSLWYATLPPLFHQRWGELNERVGLWFEGSAPPVTADSDLVAHVRSTGELLALKQRALRAHSSQTRQLESLVGPEVYRDWWATESFVAARSIISNHEIAAVSASSVDSPLRPCRGPSRPPTSGAGAAPRTDAPHGR